MGIIKKYVGAVLVIGLATGGLSACGSVADGLPTVKIEKRQHKALGVRTVSASVVDKASVACSNSEMRERAADDNSRNDVTKVLIVEHGGSGAQIIEEKAINCRDYFARVGASQGLQTQPQIVQASSASRVITQTETVITQTPAPASYRVRRGDTLWDIARSHCTTSKAIARKNGISNAKGLQIGQRLILPDGSC